MGAYLNTEFDACGALEFGLFRTSRSFTKSHDGLDSFPTCWSLRAFLSLLTDPSLEIDLEFKQ